MTPIATTLDIELLLYEYMFCDPDLPDLSKVMKLADSWYKSSEPEGFCTYPQVVNPEPLVDPVDGAAGVANEPHRCPFGDPSSS